MPPRQAIVAPVWTGEGARRFGGSAESFWQRRTLEYRAVNPTPSAKLLLLDAWSRLKRDEALLSQRGLN